MWRLFKEVFKSLSKNKVMVIGLSILIFLTATVFTLLTSVKSSMVRSFDNYKNVSKLHDLTVDMNLPTTGSAYNQGYYINGESNYELSEKPIEERKYAPIEYKINYNKSFKTSEFDDWKNFLNVSLYKTIDGSIKEYENNPLGTNILYPEGITTDFISTNLIKNAELNSSLNDNNSFFKKEDLISLYRFSQNDNTNVVWNLENINNPYFTFNNESYKIPVYKYENGKYVNKVENLELTTDSNVIFDANYKLGNLLHLSFDGEQKLISRISPIFINVESKQATLDFAKGIGWINEKVGIKIEPEQIANSLGFVKSDSSDYIFVQNDTNKDLSTFINFDETQTLHENLDLNSSFLASFFFNEAQTVDKNIFYTFRTENYLIPQSWIANQQKEISFLRFNYYISYVDKRIAPLTGKPSDNLEKNFAKGRWTGSYKTFINSLGPIDPQDGSERNELWDRLETFSYWKKKMVEKVYTYTASNGEWVINKVNPVLVKAQEVQLNPNYNFMESEYIKLFTSDTRSLPVERDGSFYAIDENNALSIKEIEKTTNPRLSQDLLNNSEDFYNSISDQEIKNKRFDIIKNNALNLTKNTIINNIKEKIGENNMGLRQSFTVDAVNDNGVKNAFHFINTGNEEYVVGGVKQNVGRLYNENFDPTLLNTYPHAALFYTDYQIPPFVAPGILVRSLYNTYPSPKYISPVISYENVRDYNNITKTYFDRPNTKIIWLNKYVEDQSSIENETQLPNYEEFNIGVYGIANTFRLVRKMIQDNGEVTYQTIYLDKNNIAPMRQSDFFAWLLKNNVTVATKFIKTSGDGWVKRNNFTSYIPFYYWSIRSDINKFVAQNASIAPLVQEVEKILLSFDFVKKGYLTSESIYRLTPLVEKAAIESNITSLVTTGKTDNGVIFKFVAKLLNLMVNDSYGNLLESILKNLITKVRDTILEHPTLEGQKDYLIKQINNLLLTFAKLDGKNEYDTTLAPAIVNIFKEPAVITEFLLKVIDSIDTKKFANLLNEWFINNENSTEVYKEKITTSVLIEYLVNSIDGKSLQNSLVYLINNLNLNKLLSIESGSLLNKILGNNSQVYNIVQKLLPKIDRDKDGQFTNVKEALSSLITSFDFNYFNGNFSSVIERNKTDYKYTVESENGLVENTQHFVLPTFNKNALIVLLVESMFNVSGSSKSFKNNIIKLFNLSDKTTEITYDNQTIWIPANDDEKLSLFDIVNAISGGGITTTSANSAEETNGVNTPTYGYQNYKLALITENILTKAKNINDSIVSIDLFNNEEYSFINNFITKEKTIDKNLLITKTTNLNKFIMQTIGGFNKVEDQSKKTGADLINDLRMFYGGSAFKLTLKTLINQLIPFTVSDPFIIGDQAFSIYTPYLSMYQVLDANQTETNKFVRDFLDLSISAEMLKLSQEADVNANIPFNTSTEFYLNKFLSNPNDVTLFNQDENGNFINPLIAQFVENNPKFKKYVENNKIQLIVQLGYIGQSAKYSAISSENPATASYYVAINSFYENYLSSSEFFAIREDSVLIANSINRFLPLEFVGISSSLLNPVLRLSFPEIAIAYLAVQRPNNNQADLINGNLAYLVMDKLANLEQLGTRNSSQNILFKQLLDSFQSIPSVSKPINWSETRNLVIDANYFNYLNSLNVPSVFDINLLKLQYDAITSILEESVINGVVFDNPRSYLAKVNFAYLANNNKSIFSGEIPNNPATVAKFINSLDDKYTININGIKFVIIGVETTVDYMYPVLDENNLQVNTTNQALVYVNEQGFQRVKNAYATNVVKEALLLKKPSNIKNINTFKNEIKEIVENAIPNNNNLERVFLTDEIDTINPERSIRITAITKVIEGISLTTSALVLLFSFLVIVSIIFIIKRYIASKNKALGILIAQGYSPTQIAASLTVFAIVTAIIGGILGYVVGNKLQFVVLDTFSAYWTLPKNTLMFNPIVAFFTVTTPWLIMSIIIYLVTIITLRIKPLNLINDSSSLPKSKFFTVYNKMIRKFGVKTRFSYILSYIGIWKLISFMVSIVLVTSASLFGLANRGVFNDTINATYENRNYKFKMDLETPTTEAGVFKTYNASHLENLIYTPIGTLNETLATKQDYLKPGYSSIINFNNANGNPSVLDPHVTSQFSLDININSAISINPWEVSYNSMPDTQKGRINTIRNAVGFELQWTQNNQVVDGKTYKFVYYPSTHEYLLENIDNPNDKLDYFVYKQGALESQGHFRYAKYDGENYNIVNITTEDRDKYRQFLVEGYRQIFNMVENEKLHGITDEDYAKYMERSLLSTRGEKVQVQKSKFFEKTVNDYYISFSGVLFDDSTDETYSYAKTEKGNLYGFKSDSKFIKLKDLNNIDLVEAMSKFEIDPIDPVYPLVINHVAANKYKLKVNDLVTFTPQNHVNRYIDKITGEQSAQEYKFKVIGINSTYINQELLTTQEIVNEMIGINNIVPTELKNNGYVPFNGILTNNEIPSQLLSSTALYSTSNYWPIITSFEGGTEAERENIYQQLFDYKKDENGKFNGLFINNLINAGISSEKALEILSDFISNGIKNPNDTIEAVYENGKSTAGDIINNFAKIHNNTLYSLVVTSIDSKDIEVGFTVQIGETVNNITIGIIAITLLISLTILIIISTIMIAENRRNIAVWSILGYTEKERLRMFFSIFIPFIALAIAISIPMVLFLIYAFNTFMLSVGSIVLMLSLKWTHVLGISLVVLLVFFSTTLITWFSISKMKAVQLLKG
ncbi:ABC transporter permease [Mycoplasmopsis iners]|uniref:ABC transporter permease n=1 Tax=Mycoplasmopsis iners TaxID=76630 RepID=UPI0004953748|nr:FtsX-like permease family protein [Mycoplasmopsis iners]